MVALKLKTVSHNRDTAADFSLRIFQTTHAESIVFRFLDMQKIAFKNVDLYISYTTRAKDVKIYNNNRLGVGQYILKFELFWMDSEEEKRIFLEGPKTFGSPYNYLPI